MNKFYENMLLIDCKMMFVLHIIHDSYGFLFLYYFLLWFGLLWDSAPKIMVLVIFGLTFGH